MMAARGRVGRDRAEQRKRVLRDDGAGGEPRGRISAGRRERAARRAAAAGRERVVISSPEELIASIPAMLGFPPAPGSVVMVCGSTAEGGQGPVIRVDVPGLGGDVPGITADEFAEVDPDATDDGGEEEGSDPGPAPWLADFCAREGVRSVHLVVVGDDPDDRDPLGARVTDTAESFTYHLSARGVEVERVYSISGFEAGEPWVELGGMTRGVQIDPASTQIAAVNAYRGRVGAASREEIARMYDVRDSDACDVDTGKRVDNEPVGDPVDTRSRALEFHDAAAGRLARGEEVDDDELAAIGRSLLVIAVRDEIYRRLALDMPGDGDGREQVWWAVARRRPRRERSTALTLLGASAYFSGNGIHASCALRAAIEADSGNSMAKLLSAVLDQGVAPDRLRRVAIAGRV